MINQIFVKGINFKSSPLWQEIRVEQLRRLEANVKSKRDLIFLNTCNRVELYGLESTLANQLLNQSLDKNLQAEMYTKEGRDAVKHMFKVACGLESQLLGEIEILGQFKHSFKEVKERNQLGGYLERLSNTCIQSAKEIRTSTKLTSGTSSLSYAVIQLLKNKQLNPSKKILLIGAGSFASSIARNLRYYMPSNSLTITNRTFSKAQVLAKKLQSKVLRFDLLNKNMLSYDVIIAAIPKPFEDVSGLIHASNQNHIVIDFGVPSFFDEKRCLQSNIEYASLRDANKIIDSSLQMRQASVPDAQNILMRHMHEFLEWSKVYEKSDTIKSWKANLSELSSVCPHLSAMSEEMRSTTINKSLGNFVQYLKSYSNRSLSKNDICTHYLVNELGGKCALRGDVHEACHNCKKTCQNPLESEHEQAN